MIVLLFIFVWLAIGSLIAIMEYFRIGRVTVGDLAACLLGPISFLIVLWVLFEDYGYVVVLRRKSK